MSNVFQDFLNTGRLTPTLRMAARLTESELSEQAGDFPPDQFPLFEGLACNQLNNLHVKSAVLSGGLLYLHHCLADKQSRTKAFQDLCARIGISESHGYALKATFRDFGLTLLNEPGLMAFLPLESLKKLSATHASPRARGAALALAKQGTRVSMELADELLFKHAETYEPGEEQAPPPAKKPAKSRHKVNGKRRPRGKKIWSYQGEVVSLVVEAPSPMVNSDPLSVIRDLEAALANYRSDFDVSGRGGGGLIIADELRDESPDEPTDEPTHDDQTAAPFPEDGQASDKPDHPDAA